MGVLSSMAGLATKTAARYEKQAVHAAGFAARRAKAVGTPAFERASAKMAKVARTSSRNAAVGRYAAQQLGQVEKGAKAAGWVTGITPTVRMAGMTVRGTARAAGAVATPFAKHPWAMGSATAAAGVVSGVASGVRGTLRDANRQAGDPVGTYADLSVRTAFSGNPANSRTKRASASGNIPLNMGKR